MTKTTRRKPNTALVYNPSRGLSIGGRSTVRKANRSKNPTRRAAAPTANPRSRRRARVHHRRRRNPASASGWLIASAMTAVGVTFTDLLLNKLPLPTSLFARVGIKLGAAYALQSYGSKIPVIGKYHTEMALVFGVLGFSDLLRAYVVPTVSSAISGFTGGGLQLVPAPAPAAAPATDGTFAGINNWRRYA